MIKNYNNNTESFEGAVIKLEGHYWMDGMTQRWAICWDIENHCTRQITYDYNGLDCRNLCNMDADVDLNTETARDIIRTIKVDALVSLGEHIKKESARIRKGDTAKVIRGRKVKKGTTLNVFWVGEKETYLSKQYSWMHETEEIAGAYTEDGQKVWIKTEYLQRLTKDTPMTKKERKEYIKNFTHNWYHTNGFINRVAAGE